MAQNSRYFESLLSIKGQQEPFSKYLLLSIVDTHRRVFVAQLQLGQTHARGQVFVREQLFFEMRLVGGGQFAQQETTNRFIREILLSVIDHLFSFSGGPPSPSHPSRAARLGTPGSGF